jgi:hypothetical protein
MARNLNVSVEFRIAIGKLKRYFGDTIPTEVELSEVVCALCLRDNLPAVFLDHAFSEIKHTKD